MIRIFLIFFFGILSIFTFLNYTSGIEISSVVTSESLVFDPTCDFNSKSIQLGLSDLYQSVTQLSVINNYIIDSNQSGCCSWHDGVCGCEGGRKVCCDGTLSPSCRC